MNKIKVIPNDKIEQEFKNIAPGTNFVPEWYKKSLQNIHGTNTELSLSDPLSTTSTYKKCSPFLDALTSGYIVYLTSDVEVTLLENNQPYIMWRSSNRTIVTNHDKPQWDGLIKPENCHDFVYKWHNTFTFKTPKNYSILFSHPANRFDLPFYTLSGVVDSDKYNLPVHFPFFLKSGFTGIIEKGTPIAQINFIKRDEWDRDFIMYDENNSIINLEKYFSKIKRSYKNTFWNKKVYK
jgi:hypothetical protein